MKILRALSPLLILHFGIVPAPSLHAADPSTSMKKADAPQKLTAEQHEALLQTLQTRFEKNPARHKGIAWEKVLARLEAASPAKLRALHEMEATGGEPDVIALDARTGEVVFFDCSPETPKGRVSVCYDREGLESRKEHRPKTSALDMAAEMGVEILSAEEYQTLQTLGEFDRKTSSWVLTPPDVRKLGGALFGDRRYGRVFIYHNGAQSYYAVRGFRASLRV